MKISCLRVGGRTVKTVLAVYLCLLIGIVRKSDTAFYAAIAAVLCVQRTSKDSIREAINREVVVIALIINQFPIRRAKGRRIWIKGKQL